MNNLKISNSIQNDVRDYFQFTQSTLLQQQELNIFLDLISPSLKIKIQRIIFIDILQRNQIISQVIQDTSPFQKKKTQGDMHMIPMNQSEEMTSDFLQILV